MSEAVLYLVPTPIGNLEDITRRAARILGEVSCIACEDTRTTRKLLGLLDIQVPALLSVFEGNEAARVGDIVSRLQAGESVALVSEAGTPGISDPGQRVVADVVAAGHRVVALPGAVAATTALTASGLPTERFLFVGFLPRSQGARQQLLGSLADDPATLVFYESPERVAATLADMAEAFGGDRPAVLARELTKMHEEYVRGTVQSVRAHIAAHAPRGECTLVIGGGDPGAARAAVDVEAAVRELLSDGLSPKEVAQRLVVKTGRPRRELYQLALALKKE